MQATDRLIVALDVNSRDSALSLVQTLRPRVQRFKVGLELFTACGPALVREILEKGGQVFLDLKFHDIPNTVARAAVSAARLGVGMFTIHLSGGPLMARRAADELEAHCQVYRVQRPKILGVDGKHLRSAGPGGPSYETLGGTCIRHGTQCKLLLILNYVV